MIFKKLGKSKATVAAIGQGCMGVGGDLARNAMSDQEHVAALRLGIELGMTLIDTAEVYGNGHSEELIGQATRGIRDEVFIATKFSPENNGCENVLRAAEGSLQRLQTDQIDLYQVHWPNPAIPISDTMRALEKLVQDGKVRYIGLSNFSVAEMRAAAAVTNLNIVSNQVEYNLFDRFIELGVLPYSQAEDMTVIAYSPLDKGHISARNDLLNEIGKRYGMTPAQIILNWIIHQKNVVTIPKATNLVHVRENAAAANFVLDEEDIRQIAKVFSAEPILVPVDDISVSLHGEGKRQVYQTLDQALRNDLKFVPSPAELAGNILKGETIKPVRIVPAETGAHQYDLIEGRIRYWAWVIAHDGNRPIPSLVRHSRR